MAAFDAPTYFSQPINALVFRPEVLRDAMPRRDLTLMTMMRSCLEQIGAQRGGYESLIDQVRTTIRRQLPDGYPLAAERRRLLQLSPTSIQRELSLAEHDLQRAGGRRPGRIWRRSI